MKTLEEILQHPAINQAGVAKLMYPNNKRAAQNLADKLARRQGKRITEQDRERLRKIISEL